MTFKKEIIQTMKTKLTILALSALLIAQCAIAKADKPQFVIADKGFAKAAIVIPKDAPKSAQYAAGQLAKYLNKITGANLPVTTKKVKGFNTIKVGFPYEGKLDEISIKVSNKNLMEITGEGPRGPAYAVFDFLETLGCGFWNREIETIPSSTNLTVEVGYEKTEAPFMEWRNLSTQVYGSIDDCLKMRANACSNISDQKWLDTLGCHRFHIEFSHSFGSRWLNAKKNDNYNKYLECYAQWDPPRTNRSAWAICPTNPKTVDVVCKEIEEYLNKNPWMTSISLSPADTPTYCRCPSCEKMIASDPSKAPTTLYIHFANQVARRLGKKWPKVKFLILAYMSTVNPPTGGIKCDPNVGIAYAQLWRNHGRPITSCERFTPNIEAWQKASDTFYYWEYYANFSDYIAFFPNWDIIDEAYKFYATHKFKGGFAQLPLTPNTPLGQHNVYIINRLQWDPTLDAQVLSSNYIENVYGRAAPDVRRFFDFATHCRDRQRWVWQGCYIRGSRHLLSAADVLTYYLLSKEVEKKISRDPLRRIMGHRFPCSALELMLFRYNDVLAVPKPRRFVMPTREELRHELLRRWGDSGSYYWSWWAERGDPLSFCKEFNKYAAVPTAAPIYEKPSFSVTAKEFNKNGSTVTLEKDQSGFEFARFIPEKRLNVTRTFMDTKTDCIGWEVHGGVTNRPYYCFAEMRVDARVKDDPAAAYFGIYNVPIYNGLQIKKNQEETGSMRVERQKGDYSWKLASLGKFDLTTGSLVWVMAGFVNPVGNTDVRRFTFVQPDLLEKTVSFPNGEESLYFDYRSIRANNKATIVRSNFDNFKYFRIASTNTATFDIPPKNFKDGEYYIFARARASVKKPLVFNAAQFTICTIDKNKVGTPIATECFSASIGELPWQLIPLGKHKLQAGVRIKLENLESEFVDWRDIVLVTPNVFEK